MSAPVAATWSTVSALTVPAVPTGMKAGVRMSPRLVFSTLVRAAPSVAAMSKGKAVMPPPLVVPYRVVDHQGHTVAQRHDRMRRVGGHDRRHAGTGHLGPPANGHLQLTFDHLPNLFLRVMVPMDRAALVE